MTIPAWDSYDIYLFDIDGTLLQCTDAVHYYAFCATLTGLAGRPVNLDGVVAHGNTDRGILRDALTLHGVPEQQWRPRLEEACAALCKQVEGNRSDLRITVLPSVNVVLEHLQGRGALLGVGTGNLAQIGRLKLTAGGLLPYFTLEGYSDGFEQRHDVLASALTSARQRVGAAATACVIGDTPADIAAAKANAVDVIAVATGTFTYDQLAAHGPTQCIHTLGDLFQESACSAVPAGGRG